MSITRATACQTLLYKKDHELLVILSGILRMNNSDELKTMLLSNMHQESVKIIYFHLGDLLELDSAGLGVLVGLHMTARRSKQILHLIAPTNHQLRLFQITRLDTVFTILPPIDAANIRGRLENEACSVASLISGADSCRP